MNWWRLRTRIHISWLIAVLCVGIILGVMLRPQVPGGLFGSVVWLYVGLVLISIGFWRRRVWVVVIIFMAGGSIGLWRGSVAQLQLAPYAALVGQNLTIRGSVSEDVDIGKNDEAILRLEVLTIDGRALAGKVWVSASTKLEVKRGDYVTVKGELAEGFGSFTGAMYRAHVVKVQRPEPGDVARQIRDEFADGVRAAVPEPQASLGIGFLVGQRRALPPELSEALQIAGLMHIVVASGYNLTILVRIARRLFVKVSKYLATLSAAGMIVGFIAVTGMSPSMSRAGLVAGISLLAWYYGRKVHPLVLLPFAAAVTLLINPSYGWGDLGWQLSFAAFAGVMIVAPLAQRYLFGEQKPGLVRQIIGETASATIVTLPIIVLAFGQFSNVAIVANVLVLPLVPLAMLLTFMAGIGALLMPSVAGSIGLPVAWLLQYMTSVAQYLAALPWAQSTLTINGMVVALYYAALAAVCLYVARVTKFNLRNTNIVE